MRNRLWSAAAGAALAATLVLLLPGQSEAQRRGWGGNRGGFGISVGNPYSGGFYASYGNVPYYGGYGGYGGYGYPGYGYGYGNQNYNPWAWNRGISVNIGSGYGYGYGNPYSNWGYGYSPSYSYRSWPVYSSGYSSNPYYAYNPSTVGYQSFYPPDGSYNQQPLGDSAGVTVRVPADAEVFFDGNPTQQRGSVREFQTPPLQPNKTFTYQVRARWNQDGQPMDQTRAVEVRAGQNSAVDFNAPQQQSQQLQKDIQQQPKQ